VPCASLFRAICDCAALGASVTVTGGGTRWITRLYGFSFNATDLTLANNYAYNGMRLYSSGTYGNSREESTVYPSEAIAANNYHGADANLGDFRNRSFWTTSLGFAAANWDFVTVEGRGYPILRASPNGPRMGGQ
jgi:hypothetical protein